MAVGLLATSAPALSFANDMNTVKAGLQELTNLGLGNNSNLRIAGNLIKTARATKSPTDIAAAQAAVNALNLQNSINKLEYAKIMLALDVVVTVDRTVLNATLANANAKVQADYTAASWTAFQADYNAAKLLPDATQAQVDAKTVAIKAAIAKLVLVQAPTQLIKNVEKLGDGLIGEVIVNVILADGLNPADYTVTYQGTAFAYNTAKGGFVGTAKLGYAAADFTVTKK